MLARNGQIDVLFDTANSSFTGTTEVQNVEKIYPIKDEEYVDDEEYGDNEEYGDDEEYVDDENLDGDIDADDDGYYDAVMRKNRNIPLSTKRRTSILP